MLHSRETQFRHLQSGGQGFSEAGKATNLYLHGTLWHAIRPGQAVPEIETHAMRGPAICTSHQSQSSSCQRWQKPSTSTIRFRAKTIPVTEGT